MIQRIAQESKTRLARVGFDRVIGQLEDLAGVFTRWHPIWSRPLRVSRLSNLAELLYTTSPSLQLVDVRNPGETAEGVVPGAREIPLPTLTDSIESLDYRAPVVTYCASGYRSLVAASLFAPQGSRPSADLIGGYGAWEESGAA